MATKDESSNHETIQLSPDRGDELKALNSQELAVSVESAYKSYGKQEVLKDLSLSVPRGAIYGLLGPSGCGKTTMLRCIVGRMSMDAGRVVVLGKEPGSKGHTVPGSSVGYMPQETALYNDFTIGETLTYFGLLHDMKWKEIKERTEFLIDFLDLPRKDRFVATLSGGQKRRVSMAVALLQQPKLLILDEPTVGVDPLLREKIWSHLIEISKNSQTTIVITTHYITEAEKADRVGLMRDGKILAEDSPSNLLTTYNETCLENVFLKLCISDSIRSPTNLSIKDTEKQIEQSQRIKKKKKSISSTIYRSVSNTIRRPKFKNYLSIIYKDSLLIWRQLAFFFFQIIIPMVQIALNFLCVGREPFDLNFGIVNNETLLNKSDARGSLLFIDQLSNQTFNKQYLNWSHAYQLTKAGKLWGYVDIGENFTRETIEKFSSFSPSDETILSSNVRVYLDTTSQQIAILTQARLLEAYQSFIKQFSPNFPFPLQESFFEFPVTFVDPPIYGEYNSQFLSYTAPGIMVTIMFTITIGLTGLMFVIEKKEGLLDRSLVAGVHVTEIMMAHISIKLAIQIFQITLLMAISTLAFGIQIKGSFILASLLLLLQGFCGMSYGLALSALHNDEKEVLTSSIGSIFPVIVISGIIWPMEAMPYAIRYISYLSPMTFAAEAMRSIVLKGWGLAYPIVWIGFGTTIAWSFLFNLIAVLFFNY